MGKGKILAIKGHSTRGKEVIKLLEMMGGNNRWGASGVLPNLYYFISNECIIYSSQIEKDVVIFTLEEFLEKYPFKVGDKVFLYDNITEGCVTGMKWDEDKGTVKYCVYTSAECWCDVKELLKWNAIDLVEKHYKEQCEEMTKDITLKHLYELGMENIKDEFRKDFCERCGSQRCYGQDDELEYCERFKNLIKEEMKSKREYDELRMPLDDDDKLATEATIMGKKIFPPDGYLVGKITQTDNGMLVEYVEKKPVYPKTYKECCDVLLIPPYYNLRYHTYESGYREYATSNTLLSLQDKLNTLGKLLICHNAYRKILGEEIGLGKPWEPDWTNEEQKKYCIYYGDGNIQKGTWSIHSSILAFPTEEIRDAFYENFKDLIEQSKELL